MIVTAVTAYEAGGRLFRSQAEAEDHRLYSHRVIELVKLLGDVQQCAWSADDIARRLLSHRVKVVKILGGFQ